jgi:hypothetical protein
VKRTVSIVCTEDLPDREWFRDKFVTALIEYADALEIGTAGNDVSEIFKASNGVQLRVEHSKEEAKC